MVMSSSIPEWNVFFLVLRIILLEMNFVSRELTYEKCVERWRLKGDSCTLNMNFINYFNYFIPR